MEPSVMWEGLKLLILGMGGVFIFLAVLIQLMRVSAAFFVKYAHLFPEEKPAAAKPAAGNEEEQIAVAIAAIKAKM